MATKPGYKIKYSSQEIDNMSFDEDTNTSMVLPVGYDGQNIQFPNADALAVKITESGTNTYIGIAAPGTAEATAKWQCKKIDESTGTVITFADGDANFDNTATDLTAHSYS